MKIITGIAFILLNSNIAIIDCAEKIAVTETTIVTQYKVEPGNEFIEDKGNNLIVWKAAVNEKSGIQVHVQLPGPLAKLGALRIALCDPGLDPEKAKMLAFFLANGKPCPIQKGTSSHINGEYKEEATRSKSRGCKSRKLKLSVTFKNDLIISIDIETKITGEGCP